MRLRDVDIGCGCFAELTRWHEIRDEWKKKLSRGENTIARVIRILGEGALGQTFNTLIV